MEMEMKHFDLDLDDLEISFRRDQTPCKDTLRIVSKTVPKIVVECQRHTKKNIDSRICVE